MKYDIILSGPISGHPNTAENFALEYANRRARANMSGAPTLKIWNPKDLPPNREYVWYMRQCCEAIMGSPTATVVMLPGWEDSPGARAEHALAKCLKMRIEERFFKQ